MKNLLLIFSALLMLSSCLKKDEDNCDGYEFEFDYVFINNSNSRTEPANIFFSTDIQYYATLNNDECAENLYSLTGNNFTTIDQFKPPEVSPGEIFTDRLRSRFPGSELKVDMILGDDVIGFVGPNDLLRITFSPDGITDDYEVEVVRN